MQGDSPKREEYASQRNSESDEDSLFADKWKTLHRPLPKAVYDVITGIEDMVGVEIGNLSSENRSIGQSVAVWTIIGMFLLENAEPLKEKAREWRE